MHVKVVQWLGREFVVLYAEGESGLSASAQTADLFSRFEQELRRAGLSLENLARTRIWAKDRASRDAASKGRIAALTGKARAASSSFVAPGRFASGALVALDVIAMRPRREDAQRLIVEYSPPQTPIRYLKYDSLAFLSGVTSRGAGLSSQVPDILDRISGSLRDAGSSWSQAASAFLCFHRSQSLDSLRELFRRSVPAAIPVIEYANADGYASEGCLLEIEVTAVTGAGT